MNLEVCARPASVPRHWRPYVVAGDYEIVYILPVGSEEAALRISRDLVARLEQMGPEILQGFLLSRRSPEPMFVVIGPNPVARKD